MESTGCRSGYSSRGLGIEYIDVLMDTHESQLIVDGEMIIPLIVEFLVPPAPWATANSKFPDLIIDKDEKAEGHGDQPPLEPDGHEVEDVRHPWAVAQEAANADLEHDGDHQDLVPEESLLENREAPCLADEDICDLAHLDADEEHGVTGVLLVQALTKCPFLAVAVLKIL